MSLITKHSYFNLFSIGIPTEEWEEYYDESQLFPDVTYRIGVLKEDHSYIASATISGREDQIAFIKELQRQYGQKANIIIQEVLDYEATGTVVIKPNDVEIDGEVTEDETMKLSLWAALLSKDFMFESDIVLKWGRDTEGRLIARDIS